MVGATEAHYLKSQDLLSEFGRRAKTDWEVDLTHREGLLDWYNSMEASYAWFELCSFDPQKVEGLEVDDVESAATIHQHL